jgi:hypothetical protein
VSGSAAPLDAVFEFVMLDANGRFGIARTGVVDPAAGASSSSTSSSSTSESAWRM